MTTSEVSNGLVVPYAALTLAGKGGAAAVVLIIFMAVTSTLSAQVIAVSSIISFDIYREYFNKSATDRQIIHWSHFGVVFFALFSAGFSTMLYYAGADLQWTLYMLGKFSDRNQVKVLCLLTPIRCRHLPWHLPHGVHCSLAPPKHDCCYHLAGSWPDHWHGGLAGNRAAVSWRGYRLFDRPSLAVRLRDGGVCLLADSVLGRDYLLGRATELRLGRFPKGASRAREAGR